MKFCISYDRITYEFDSIPFLFSIFYGSVNENCTNDYRGINECLINFKKHQCTKVSASDLNVWINQRWIAARVTERRKDFAQAR